MNVISVSKKTITGSNACKKIRKTGNIPAIVYGNKKDPIAITVPQKEFSLHLRSKQKELTLKMEDGESNVVIREVQYDPTNDAILHADFQYMAE